MIKVEKETILNVMQIWDPATCNPYNEMSIFLKEGMPNQDDLVFQIAKFGIANNSFAMGMILMYKIIEDQMIANATAELESLVK